MKLSLLVALVLSGIYAITTQRDAPERRPPESQEDIGALAAPHGPGDTAAPLSPA